MAICPALRGIILILALLEEEAWIEALHVIRPDKRETQPGYYLTGQVIAVPVGAIHELPLQRDFGGPRRWDFAKLNLHLPACAKSCLAGRRQGPFLATWKR